MMWASLDKSILAKARLVARDPLWNGFLETHRGKDAPNVQLDGRTNVGITTSTIELGAYASSPSSVSGQWTPIDIAVSPVDGHQSLLDGYVGSSMSVVAGMARGSLQRPSLSGLENPIEPDDMAGTKPTSFHDNQLCTRFLIVAGGARIKALAEATGLEALPKLVDGSPLGDSSSPIRCWIDQLIDEISIDRSDHLRDGLALSQQPRDEIDWFRDVLSRPTIATHESANKGAWLSAKHVFHPTCQRLRVFHGSPLGAVAATMVPNLGLDLYIGIVREATAMMAALIAQTVGGFFIAVPIVKEEHGPLIPAGASTVPLNKVVLYDDVFVTMTSITPHPLLRGVTATSTGTFQTHSVIFNGMSRTVRFVSHRRKLSEDHFYSFMTNKRVEESHKVFARMAKEIFCRTAHEEAGQWEKRARELDEKYIS